MSAAVVGDRRVGARLLAHWCRLLVRCVPVSLGISFLTLLILSNGIPKAGHGHAHRMNAPAVASCSVLPQRCTACLPRLSSRLSRCQGVSGPSPPAWERTLHRASFGRQGQPHLGRTGPFERDSHITTRPHGGAAAVQKRPKPMGMTSPRKQRENAPDLPSLQPWPDFARPARSRLDPTRDCRGQVSGH